MNYYLHRLTCHAANLILGLTPYRLHYLKSRPGGRWLFAISYPDWETSRVSNTPGHFRKVKPLWL